MASKIFQIFAGVILMMLSQGSSSSDVLSLKLPEKVTVCYFARWAVYRPDHGKYDIEHINPSLCTHLIYSFAGLDPDKFVITSLDSWQDFEDGLDGYRKATQLKQNNPDLKVLLAIGGWTQGSINFSKLAKDPNLRKKFINSVMQMITKYSFDGLDLDWEYPTQRGGNPEDRKNYVSLVQELREAFNTRYLITMAVGSNPKIIDEGYDLVELTKYLNFFHLMSYDYHGTWDGRVGPNAPLRSNDPLDKFTLEQSLEHMLKKGAPANKIVVGVPFYGRTFLSMNPVDKTKLIGAAARSEGFSGKYTKENGFMGYNEICLEMSNSSNKWEYHWDEVSQTPYVFNEERVIAYDNQRSIAAKVNYVINKGVAGIMVWSMDTDDFRADCSNYEPDKYTAFYQEAKAIEEDPRFKEAVPTLSALQFEIFPYFSVENNKITLVDSEKLARNYPLLRTIRASQNLCLQLQVFKKKLDEANEVVPDSDKSANRGGRSYLSYTLLPFIAFVMSLVYMM